MSLAWAAAWRFAASIFRRGGTPNREEPAIVALRISILLCCSTTLGACVATSTTAPPAATFAPVAVANGALPRNAEPGQLLTPGLGAGAHGVDPAAQLDASARDRAAWAPLGADAIGQSAIAKTHNAGRAASDDRPGLNGMASPPPASDGHRRAAASPAPGRDATMDRLEREGQRTAKPICAAC